MAACRVVLPTPVPLYFCPARGAPQVGVLTPSGGIFDEYQELAANDYAANSGQESTPTRRINGVFAGRPRIGGGPNLPLPTTPARFTDGLANTLFVADSRYQSGRRRNNYLLYGYVVGRGETVAKCTRNHQPYPPHADDDPAPPWVSAEFGSAHPAGVNAAFGDGAVRVVRYAIDPEVWQRLCVRDDGLPVALD